jgi:hypothetical protein
MNEKEKESLSSFLPPHKATKQPTRFSLFPHVLCPENTPRNQSIQAQQTITLHLDSSRLIQPHLPLATYHHYPCTTNQATHSFSSPPPYQNQFLVLQTKLALPMPANIHQHYFFLASLNSKPQPTILSLLYHFLQAASPVAKSPPSSPLIPRNPAYDNINNETAAFPPVPVHIHPPTPRTQYHICTNVAAQPHPHARKKFAPTSEISGHWHWHRRWATRRAEARLR